MKTTTTALAALLGAGLHAASLTVGCPTASIDEFRQLAEYAKTLGATHLDACQIEHSLWQWNRNREDPYPNWSMHRPSIFKFVVPEELKKYLPADYAKRNLDALKARAAILREFGFKADFMGMEPAYFPEEAYLEHPAWRGARCDQARRARFEYFAPCVDNPEVRAMYVKAVAELCRVCPFDRFKFRCNDSGSALCWSESLYCGKNGPEACSEIPYGQRVANALSIFQEGAAKAGLPDAKVNFRASLGPEEAIFPWLKPGQSVNNRTASGASAAYVIGYPNRFTDYTAPIFGLTRLPALVEQLQKVQANPQGDVEIGLRTMIEFDAMELLKRYLRKPVGEGPAARWLVIGEIARVFVGDAAAPRLVAAWEALDEAIKRTDSFYTGGHLFLLGSLHQRWITRPLVAFPNELQGEDRFYWREFIFQAQDEDAANNLLDLQANRWLSGHGGEKLASMVFTHRALPLAKKAAKLFAECVDAAVDARARRFLADQAAKSAMYVCIIENALHAIAFQRILDRTDFNEEPEDETLEISEQGDARLHKINLIVRAEIDNTLKMIDIVERAADPVFDYARTDEEQTIMRFGPKKSFIRDLKRKIAIMEVHRRDFLRLYKSYNR